MFNNSGGEIFCVNTNQFWHKFEDYPATQKLQNVGPLALKKTTKK